MNKPTTLREIHNYESIDNDRREVLKWRITDLHSSALGSIPVEIFNLSLGLELGGMVGQNLTAREIHSYESIDRDRILVLKFILKQRRIHCHACIGYGFDPKTKFSLISPWDWN